MVNEENQDSPILVWTFPIITRLQKGNGIISLGTSAMSERVGDVKESGPVRDRLMGDGEEEDNDEIGEIENQLEEVSEGDSVFSQDDESVYSQPESDNLVEIEDDVFIPVRIEVDSGETVTWMNEDDSTHRVVSSSGDDFSSEQLEPGESFSHTFREEGVTQFFDSIEGQQEMCGAVIVGDAELDATLPCEEEGIARELFSQSQGQETRTMSAAAEEKEEMDMGF